MKNIVLDYLKDKRTRRHKGGCFYILQKTDIIYHIETSNLDVVSILPHNINTVEKIKDMIEIRDGYKAFCLKIFDCHIDGSDGSDILTFFSNFAQEWSGYYKTYPNETEIEKKMRMKHMISIGSDYLLYFFDHKKDENRVYSLPLSYTMYQNNLMFDATFADITSKINLKHLKDVSTYNTKEGKMMFSMIFKFNQHFNIRIPKSINIHFSKTYGAHLHKMKHLTSLNFQTYYIKTTLIEYFNVRQLRKLKGKLRYITKEAKYPNYSRIINTIDTDDLLNPNDVSLLGFMVSLEHNHSLEPIN
jgi:hypothetical protein